MHKTNADECPACKHKLDAATSLVDEAKRPPNGSFGGCAYCGVLLVYHDSGLRIMSDQEKEVFKKGNPVLYDKLNFMLEASVKMFRSRN